MKTMMRRLTALVMVLSFCTGILVLPAAAEEAQPQETTTTVTVEITGSSGEVIGEKTTTTTTVESGSTTTETTKTTTTDTTGTVTGEGTSSTTTQVETTQTETGGSQTDTEKTWESTQTEYGPVTEAAPDENTTQKTEGDTQTVVEGSSEKQDHVEPTDEGTHYFGSETGQETTTVTDTSTTTTTKTNQILSSETEDTKTTKSGYQEYHDWINTYLLDKYGNWKKSGAYIHDPKGFQKIDGSESDPVNTEKEEDLVEDPLAKTDVKLEMDAPTGNKEYTESDKEIVIVNLIDLIPPESDTVKHVYENGVLVGYITYSNEQISPESDNNPIIPDDTPKTDADYTPVGEVSVTKVKPAEPIPNTSDDDHITIDTQITELDNNCGYHVVETKVITTDYMGEGMDPLSGDQNDFVIPPVIPEDAIPYSSNSYIQLPKRSDESETTDSNGNTTKVTVEELRDENDNLIGFKTTTRVADKDGNLISNESTSEYGSITTFKSTTTLDPKTNEVTIVTESVIMGLLAIQEYEAQTKGNKDIRSTRDADQDIYQIINPKETYQMVETEDGLIFLYQGKLYRVLDESTNDSSRDVINRDTVSLNSFIDGAGEGAANDLRTSKDSSTGYYTGGTKGYNVDGAWTLTGHGLFSDLEVKEINGNEHTTKQFEIQKENADGTIEKRFVYCVEMGTDLSFSDGSDYGVKDYYTDRGADGENDPPWTDATGTIAQLRSVALNGFWGTEEGLGSLQAVKDLMRRNGVEGWEELTPGMAVTATQVAIWEFGAKNSGQFGGYDENGNPYLDSSGDPLNAQNGYEFIYRDNGTDGIDADKMEIVEALRDLLVRLAYDEEEGKTEEIDGSDVVGGAITLKNKISDGENDADVYNTDISFTLDVSTSSLNGDLIVDVQVGGESVGRARLAGNDDMPTLFNFGRIYPVKDEDGNYVYTIEDVELAAGVVVDLRLTGTQHLDDGIYIFENATWQDFIGLSTLERDVDMTISMEFRVEDPQIVQTEQSWEESKTDKEGYVRTDLFHKERNGTETTENMTVTTAVYGTTVQSDVTTTVTKVEREWEKYYDYTVPDPDDSEKDPADPPKTGDTTLILALVSLFSGTGLVVLNGKKKEE